MALFRRKKPAPPAERDLLPYSLDQWAADFTYQGNSYPVFSLNQSGDSYEGGEGGFEGYIQTAYRSNGVAFACVLARLMVFSDARFTFREIRNNVPGDITAPADGRNPATAGLALLRRPWVGGTTGDLLARMISDVDTMGGNAFIARRGNQLVRLRPDWVTIVASTPEDATLWHPDAEVAGYLYKPGGPGSSDDPVTFLRDEVAHFAPTPDPVARFRGISWMDSILTELQADRSATAHKAAYFKQGATVNLMLSYPPEITKDMYEFAVRQFRESHEGAQNAYRTMHLIGATATPVGSDMQQVDFKNVQAAGETRVAMAAGVPAAILGNSEGLQGSSLNTGNFQAARRLFGDRTIRPLWRNACGSLETIIPTPPRAELWYDDSDVAFLREDKKDAAEVRQMDAATLSSLVSAGYDPTTALDAVTSGDFRRLEHTGLVSVQLLPPGQSATAPPQVGENARLAMRDALRGIVVDTVKGEMKQLTLDFIERSALPSSPEVNVTMPEVRVEPQTINVNVPEREVNVSSPEVNVTSPDVNITVPPADPTPVTVNVETAPITVDVPEQRAPDITVNVPDGPAPTVNVQAPDVTVNVPESPVPSIEVHVPEQQPPTVEVNVPRRRRTRKTIERDETGVIESVIEEEVE